MRYLVRKAQKHKDRIAAIAVKAIPASAARLKLSFMK